MNKAQFLDQKDVKNFVKWLSMRLDDETFAHGYMNRRTGENWKCASLYDAFSHYDWSHPAISRLGVNAGRTFQSNTYALEALRRDLLRALTPPIDDEGVCQAAIDVMKWGGVVQGNVSWLHANRSGLARLIMEVRDGLNAADAEHPILASQELRFNAGMTKIYSLVCDDFIIYDSRVAAALGWAVTKFCEAPNIELDPGQLGFPYAPAKESPHAAAPKRRNPSVESLIFPALRPGAMHATWNLYASWLLCSVLDKASNSKFIQVGARRDQLRALEAALFMIGYDLSASSVESEKAPVDIEATPEPVSDWTAAFTPTRGHQFAYRINDEGIEIENSNVRFSDITLNRTLNSLHSDFGSSPFPLANSAVGVRAGTEPNGLGTAYYRATDTRGNPPNTSKLAAVLNDLGILVPVERYWSLNVDAPGLVSQSSAIDIRAFFARLSDRED